MALTGNQQLSNDIDQPESPLHQTPNSFLPIQPVDPVNNPGLGQVSDAKNAILGAITDIERKSASNIALIITWTFTGSAALLLVGLYFILLRNPADAKLLLDAAVPALKETGTFLSTVFGPLLGFVLGYYFRDRKDRD